ncbi:hypothetical protein [Microcoleus vaginatus]|uniref:hypothetical protein n=1 Tax=Microcoleus vaginatus TaxID=119532 RepID=UPI0032A2B912
MPNRESRGIEVPHSCVPPTSVVNKDAWSAERPPQAVQRIAETIIPVPGWCGGLGYHEFF